MKDSYRVFESTEPYDKLQTHCRRELMEVLNELEAPDDKPQVTGVYSNIDGPRTQPAKQVKRAPSSPVTAKVPAPAPKVVSPPGVVLANSGNTSRRKRLRVNKLMVLVVCLVGDAIVLYWAMMM